MRIRRQWREVIRAKTKTVSVTNDVYPTVEAQRKYPMKYPYAEITAVTDTPPGDLATSGAASLTWLLAPGCSCTLVAGLPPEDST